MPNYAQVRQVCAGGMHSLALLEDGTLYSWGVNDEGALGRQTDGAVWEEAEVSSRANALHRVL